MRKLDPEQAQAIKDRAWEIDGFFSEDGLIQAIDELTAKPGEEIFCGDCPRWWRGAFRQREGCQHPKFDGETCPKGRWESG